MSFVLRRRFSSILYELKKCTINNYPIRCKSTSFSTGRTNKNYIKAAIAGLGFSTGYTLINVTNNSESTSDNPSVINSNITTSSLPKVEVSRQIKIPGDSSCLNITLFQYTTCPFCCKVRAFLDYYGISYNIVEVNPVLRQQIKWSQYKKVPILLVQTGDEYLQLNDSSMIISSLASYLKDRRTDLKNITQSYPAIVDKKNPKKIEILNKYFIMQGSLEESELLKDKEERKWRQWADDVLVHTLSPNVYRTPKEALEAFNWFSEIGEWDKLFSIWERLLIIYVGAYAMWLIGKRLKNRHNLKDNVRESLYDECNKWINEVNKRGQFFGGTSPCLADLAVYGVLSSIEGCLAFKELLLNTKISKWYYDMKKVVCDHAGITPLH